MGLKRNILFSSFLAVANYVFPIIVYPHVSRSLGVANIGMCNFVDGIINYFMLFSMLGIATVGIREIATAKSDKESLRRVFSSLIVFGTITTVSAIILLIVATYTVPQLESYRTLLMLGIIKLLGNFFMLDWLYRGLEDFKYVTLRTIYVKIGFVISVFIWVWKPQDYTVYYLLTCLMFAVNCIFSCRRAWELIGFSFSGIDMRALLKPILIIGFYHALTSMYTTLNITYLGFASNDTEVGYYTTATKFFTILIGLYTAFTTVMVPRMSALYYEHKLDEYRASVGKSIDVLFTFAVPLVLFACVFSHEIICLFAGNEFAPATMTARIIFPLILIIGYEQIIITQVLFTMKKEKAMFKCTLIGSIVGVVLNVVLVGKLASTGSAIVWLTSEIAVLIGGQYFVSRYINFHFPWKFLIKNLAVYCPMLAILIALLNFQPLGGVWALMTGAVVAGCYVLSAQLLVLKDPVVLGLLHRYIPSIKIPES